MKKTRVLLVDDDPLVRTTVRLALESLGYTIVGVSFPLNTSRHKCALN